MSKYIWDYITFDEYKCGCCNRLPPDFYDAGGHLYPDAPEIYRPLFKAFVDIRNKWGRPIPITDGYRCVKRHKELYKQEISTAWLSVHCFGLALDCDVKDQDEVMRLVQIVKKLHPKLRLGYKQYLYKGQSFIHIDTGFLIRPQLFSDWREGVRW